MFSSIVLPFNSFAMKIKRLRMWLEDIQEEGYGSAVLYFSDQDEDCYTVNYVYIDDDGDVCLQSFGGDDLTVDELLDQISDCGNNTYVYFERQYWDDSPLICDIEGDWYTDDYGDVVMDVVYHDDDD